MSIVVARKRRRIPSGEALVNAGVLVAVIAVVIGVWSSPGFALSGCTQASPESPSAILALLGGAVAALPVVRARFKSRSRK